MIETIEQWHIRMKGVVEELATCMQCNCDLARWEPEKLTGHSHVCRIHLIAIERVKRPTVAEIARAN